MTSADRVTRILQNWNHETELAVLIQNEIEEAVEGEKFACAEICAAEGYKKHNLAVSAEANVRNHTLHAMAVQAWTCEKLVRQRGTK